MSQSPLNTNTFPSSPHWVKNTKLFVIGWIVVFAIGLLIYFDQLFLYIIISLVLSYVLRPIVDYVERRTPLPRWVPTAFVYLAVIGALVAIPVSTIPSVVRQVTTFIVNLPDLLQQLATLLTDFLREPLFEFRGETYYVPVDQIQVEEYEQYLGQVVSLLGNSLGSVGDFAGNLAATTIEVITWIAFVIFISFYMTKDGHRVSANLIGVVPDNYKSDAHHLIRRLDLIWGAFLRGQVLLMVVIGIVVFVVATILGLPNPLALAVIAGLLEVVPYAGPVLSAIPAGLLAFFQSDASWLGEPLGAFWFTIVVLFAYWLIQQLENYILLPRIMGYQLKLHPTLVFIGAIAGWQVAGIFGIFLASPVVATLRLFLRYAYCKLTDQALFAPLADVVNEDALIASDIPPQPVESTPVPAVLVVNEEEQARTKNLV